MPEAVSRYPVPAIEGLPNDLRQRILDVQEKSGFVPNVFLAFSHRPDEFRAFFAYHDAVMLRPPSGPNGLTKGEKEMIVVATSGANNCLYCVVAHGAILRIYEKNPRVADQVAVNYRKADITPRQKAMLAFAMKVCLDSAAIGAADFALLREHGFTDEDAWDIGAITALFGLSNRMANLTSMRPNDEFYLMGRVPKAREGLSSAGAMFSIVIPTWNNLAFLQLAVETIRRHSSHAHEILIHVNDGSDGTLAWVQSQGLKHTASPDNVGICYAVNRVAALATRPYLVYLNDDMAVLPGWDRALIETAEQLRGERFMLSGTMIEPTDTGNRCVVVSDRGRTPSRFDEAGLIAALPALKRSDWLGATWPPTLIPTWMWSEVGGYSVELSPGMSSDNDFSMKLWHAGCRIFLGLGDSFVYHFACVSTGRIVKNKGGRQFLHKWGVSQGDFDRICLCRGEPVDRAAGLRGRRLDGDDERRWQRALFRGRIAARFK